jgi:hypothetical protein
MTKRNEVLLFILCKKTIGASNKTFQNADKDEIIIFDHKRI